MTPLRLLSEPRRSRLLFQGGNLLFWMALYFYVPILPVYARGMGAPLSLVGVMLSAYGVMQLLLRIPTGVASDVLGRRKPFVLGGLALTVAGALVFLWAPTPWALVLARGLTGVAATAWVAITVMYSAYYPPAQAASAMGLMGTTNGLGQVVATWTGGVAADAYGWGAPFVLSIVAGLVGLGLMALCREVRPAAPVTPSAAPTAAPMSMRRLWTVGASPTLLLVSTLSAINTFASFVTVFGFIPVYAKDLGATRAELGALTALSLIPFTIVQPLTAPLARRIGFPLAVALGLLVVGATTLAVPLTHTFRQLAVTQVLNGVGRGVLGAGFMSLAILSVDQRERATAMGVYQAVYSIGMFLGPLLGGIVGERAGLGAAFAGTGILVLGAAAWAMISLPGTQRSMPALPRLAPSPAAPARGAS